MYNGATFRIKINGTITHPINFESGVRQGCSSSGIIYVVCLEPLLYNLRNNPKIPGTIPPGAQYEAVRRKAFPYDGIDSTIKTIAYADDIDTIVFSRDEETETIKMFDLYNQASGGKTNVEKTEVFWISDWLPPPACQGQVKLDWCCFLGVPIDKRGHFPPSELFKLKMSLKQNLGMWSQVSLSHLERSTILKVFALSCIVYRLSLITVPLTTINELQKIANTFVWPGKHPTISFKTITGKKVDGGFALLDIKTMVEGFRIKCGLRLMSNSPTKWKFYALQSMATQLQRFDRSLWSNLVPHIQQGASLSCEAVDRTAKWLTDGNPSVIPETGLSIYWQLIYEYHFRLPVCYRKMNHLKNIQFFKLLLASKMSTHAHEIWVKLVNNALHIRARGGRSEQEKQCVFCDQPETVYQSMDRVYLFLTSI
ncbi:unnamed protein product [Didymodactylos carnosus]|uniref:Reverse transcriptase domain-containing protein n=1 Tax=Didymodactylos carnosus TaxID=1234261 RepID=A0A8S2ERJ1_9BILA|nr:unnamed protein product [Didymodactylos carnosus]CAF4092374.1 unnamed protein product [Didymodactylos carnosus]